EKGTLTEIFYDLRNKEYWIKRNLREVKFSERNVGAVFNCMSTKDSEEIFDLLSNESNEGLYASAFKYLGRMGYERDLKFGRFFYRLITAHSYYEILYKAKFTLGDIVRFKICDSNGKNPRDILGLTKTQYKILKKYKVNQGFLSERNKLDKANQRLLNLLTYIESLDEKFGLDMIKDFLKNEIDYIYNNEYGSYHSALKISKEYNLNEKRLIKYLYYECEVSQGADCISAIGNYRDYIRMVNEMEYKKFDKYPKYLKTMHDIVAKNYNINLSEIELKQWKKAYENNKKFKQNLGQHVILPPQNPEDLVEEGNHLGHCVGSYIGKVRKGTSIILFLRDKKETGVPLVTVEVMGDEIVQAYGRGNTLPSRSEIQSLRRFADKFNLLYTQDKEEEAIA
uniref:PcfJ domain-containing protein n=1 Tax=Bacillus pumilus TaxID=1408 RepID=UPI0011A9F009